MRYDRISEDPTRYLGLGRVWVENDIGHSLELATIMSPCSHPATRPTSFASTVSR